MTDSHKRYYALPLASREEAYGITAWLWADHDGLHCGAGLPEGTIPTGHLWGWGPGGYVHLREDPCAPAVGIQVSMRSETGAVECTVLHSGGASSSPKW